MANRGAGSSDQEGNKEKKKWVKGDGNSCAACKHWGKRCIEGECEFAPHFPADRMEDFVAVQTVFEMSNVRKMLKGTDPIQGGEMAKSLIWEANCWKDDPVHGPLGHCSSSCDQVGHLQNQISDKDEKIQLLTDMVSLLLQQPISTHSNVGLRPHHRDHLQYHRAPMLFQENAMFQGSGYNVHWGSSTFPPATSYNQNPVIVQENATFQGGYMPPRHYLQVEHRAPMFFQENATFQGGYNVASSSTFPPATAYNQNPAYNSYTHILPREDGGITVGGEDQYRALLQRRRREGDAYNSYTYILPREDGGITVGGEDQYRALLQRRRREGDDGRQH